MEPSKRLSSAATIATPSGAAFDGATQTVEALAPEPVRTTDLTTVHAVWVELTPLPLAAQSDGTLVDGGTYVSLEYQRYDLTDDETVALTEQMTGSSEQREMFDLDQ